MNDKPLSGKIVLVVDDNPTNLDVLINHLESSGFQTLVAISGHRALQQVKRLPPDLILLDIIMPGLDGYETCRQLKANQATKEIPIIFMTALTELDSKVKAFELGAVDYITKPFQYQEILARITTHLTIQHQKQQLTELNATKDKFFSIISHDLKNTFNSVLGLAKLLNDSFKDLTEEDLEEAVEVLHRSAEHTSRLLGNLLHWAGLQQGHIQFQPIVLDFSKVVAEHIALFSLQAAQKNITFSQKITSDIAVHGDREMVGTVLRNLISNAIKFTDLGGQVTIVAVEKGDWAEVSVIDTGIGIEAESIESLFEITDIHTRQYGTANEKGTGLGLSLCKDFVEKSGGQIWIESVVGYGTTVTFTLPLAPRSYNTDRMLLNNEI